jgi:hypothetical protein
MPRERNPARRFLKMLWHFRIRLRIEADGKTVTPYDPAERVSPLLVEETQRRSAVILPFVPKYIEHQEQHCAAWEAKSKVERPLTMAERRKLERRQQEKREPVQGALFNA